MKAKICIIIAIALASGIKDPVPDQSSTGWKMRKKEKSNAKKKKENVGCVGIERNKQNVGNPIFT